jgi:hypothetical protein
MCPRAATYRRAGFGTVYKGTWQRVPVAIKARSPLNRLGLASLRPGAPHVQVIKAPAGKMLSKAAQQALLQEAQIHFRLKHPR